MSRVKYKQWGRNIDPAALQQMENACNLPVSVAGAIMPDAHTGYGLPIGGVLATRDVVIPYAVGVDIACRMRLSVLDLPVKLIKGEGDRLVNCIEQGTCFGVGGTFRPRKDHDVMSADWNVSTVTARLKERAWDQLGTSGSGNHFVEIGTLTLENDDLGLQAGVYTALLSHSGSRGAGGETADYYSKLAMKKHPELPKPMNHLAWLELKSGMGLEYWAAMELMGKYAAANHEIIHRSVIKLIGAKVLAHVENHHNFAWREKHFGEELIVHRKGATPASKGTLAVIPGSMATPGFVVRGKGNPDSLCSAAHGAGRKMSRAEAMRLFTWNQAYKFLEERGVRLISAGLDEVPMSYKDIESVMAEQKDLVEVIAQFDPLIVKMAPEQSRGARRRGRR
ncbi:MAG: RtcB family protein [Lentisphaerae bacterium]|nr:RtcB family protein [Lentisphaerota bacterium]